MKVTDNGRRITGIVVGVDGSPSSVDALRWAARQARLTGEELHAVIAWQVVPNYGYGPLPEESDFSEGARDVLERTVHESLPPEQAATVHLHIGQGNAAAVLLAAAEDADLLVVGNRGHGSLVGTLLGSVSHHVTAHATCPVVVLRHPKEATPEAEEATGRAEAISALPTQGEVTSS